MKTIHFVMKILIVFSALFMVLPANAAENRKEALNIAEMWEISGLDPAREGTFVKEKAMIAETLVTANPDFSLAPGLAVSWSMTADDTWEFTLRPDVLFHNGSPFTAEAAAACLKRTLDVNPTMAKISKIKTVKATGDLVLEIVTDGLYPVLPAIMVYPDMSIIHPDSDQNEQGVVVHPLGTGPYRLGEWKKSEYRVTLERFDDYWGDNPKIRSIAYRSVPDPATRSLELQKGDLDFIPDAPYGDLDRLRKKGFNVVIASTARVYQLDFKVLKGTPMEDRRVRQALSMAINRHEIVQYILFGMGKPAAGPFEDIMVFANPDLKPCPFDLERAKSLLAEAGWKDTDGDGVLDRGGVRFTTTLYTYPQRPGLKPMAMAIQQNWNAIGIKTDVRIIDWSAISESMKPGDVRLSANATAMAPDPDYFLRKMYAGNGDGNTWGYENPEVDRLLAEGIHEKNMEKRLDIYKKIQAVVFNDLPVIHVSYYGVNTVMKPEVKGFVFNPTAHDYMLNTGMHIE